MLPKFPPLMQELTFCEEHKKKKSRMKQTVRNSQSVSLYINTVAILVSHTNSRTGSNCGIIHYLSNIYCVLHIS